MTREHERVDGPRRAAGEQIDIRAVEEAGVALTQLAQPDRRRQPIDAAAVYRQDSDPRGIFGFCDPRG